MTAKGVVLSMLCLAAAGAPADEWVSTGGPLGGLGYDVRIHPSNPNRMYVTDNFAGVAISDDAGATWRPSNNGITVRGGITGDAYPIFSLTVDPNTPSTLWTGTNGDGMQFGVFKSTDGGNNWTLKANGITTDGTGIVFRGFTVQPGDSSLVYALAEVPTTVQGREFNRTRGRVFKTVDGGDNWTLIWSGQNLARYLIVDPSAPQTLYVSTGIFDREAFNSDCANATPGGEGILKSIDGGANWNPVNNGLADLYVGSLRMHPTNPQILFAATGNNACSGAYEGNIVSGLYRSVDGGQNWVEVIDREIVTTVNFAPSNPDIVYAGSASWIYRSSDGGTTWTAYQRPGTNNWGPEGVRAGVPIDVVIDGADANLVYANNYGGGVFKSMDGGPTWAIWSRGYSGADVHAVVAPPTGGARVLAIGRSGPFRSSDHGDTWTGIATGAAQYAEWAGVTASPTDANLTVISDEHQGKILRSTNGGGTFAEVFTHPNANAADPNARQGFKALAFAPSDPTVLYAGVARDRGHVDSGVPLGPAFYKSTDGGLTFTTPGGGLDGRNVHRLVVHPSTPGTVWAATSNGVHRSTNGGDQWALLGLGGRNLTALAVHASSGLLIAGEAEGGVWKSTDNGTTWTGPHNGGISSPNPWIASLVIDPGNPAVVYAGDLYSGVYRSTDGGTNWSPFPAAMQGLGFRAVKDLALTAGRLYAATQGGGVFRYEWDAIFADGFQ